MSEQTSEGSQDRGKGAFSEGSPSETEGDLLGSENPASPPQQERRGKQAYVEDEGSEDAVEVTTGVLPGEICLATDQGSEGPMVYEGEGVGQKEQGRLPFSRLIHMDPVPPELVQGVEEPVHEPGDTAAHHDYEGPMEYEGQGVGQYEPVVVKGAEERGVKPANHQDTQPQNSQPRYVPGLPPSPPQLPLPSPSGAETGATVRMPETTVG